MLNNIKTIAGTSVGAMIGMLYCAGYWPMEIFKFFKLLNWENIKTVNIPIFLTKYGLNDGSRMMFIFIKLMSAKGFDQNSGVKSESHIPERWESAKSRTCTLASAGSADSDSG